MTSSRRPKAEPRAGRDSGERKTQPERKQQLLAHAKQLFAALGYHATTTDKIAVAAGLTEADLLRHFASKKAILVEIVEQVRSATLRRWQAATAGLDDPLARLHAITDLYLDSTLDHALECRILHRAVIEIEEEDVLSLLRAFYLESEALLAGIIAEGQQTGVFRRSLDPRIGAWQLIRTALGYTLTLPLGIPLSAEADHLPRVIECLLHGLLKTDV